VVAIIVNFDFWVDHGPILGFIPIFNGKLKSFDQKFYNTIGKTI
jgi:hypothetical protein